MAGHKKGEQPNTTNTGKRIRPSLGLLKFLVDGSQVVLQARQPGAAAAGQQSEPPKNSPTLKIDLKSGKVWAGQSLTLPDTTPNVLGVMGMMQLEKGAVLSLITRAKRVAVLPDGPVYKVMATQLMAYEGMNCNDNDLRHAALLQEALDPKTFGNHLYFSHTANITATQQRQAAAAAAGSKPVPGAAAQAPEEWWLDTPSSQDAPAARAGQQGNGKGAGSSSQPQQQQPLSYLWQHADPTFVWNYDLMQPILAASGGIAFALPVLAGYVGQAATEETFRLYPRAMGEAASSPEGASTSSSPCRGSISLISRVARGRPTAGPWRRGLDAQGCAAGYTETELLVCLRQPQPPGAAPPGQLAAAASATATSSQGGQQPQQPGETESSGDEGASRAAGGSGSGEANGEAHQQDAQHGPVDVGAPDEELEADASSGAGHTNTASSAQPPGPTVRIAVAALVMTRGSTPVMWAAPPNLQPQPAPRFPRSADTHQRAFEAHLKQLASSYAASPALAASCAGGAAAGTSSDAPPLAPSLLLLLNLLYGRHMQQQLLLHDLAQGLAAPFGPRGSATQPQAAAEAPHAKATGSAAPASSGGQLVKAASGGAAAAVRSVGWPLASRAALEQLATGGAAAVALEAAVHEDMARIGCYVAVEERGGVTASDGTGNTTLRQQSVMCTQNGALSVSSASATSEGGCVEEVDVVQCCLALPVLERMLAHLGALPPHARPSCGAANGVQDGEQGAAGTQTMLADLYSDVMEVLVEMWSHNAAALADHACGVTGSACRLLRAAAITHCQRPTGFSALWSGIMHGPWRRLADWGDFVSRWYYTCFQDARRQDIMDMACGAYKISNPPVPMPPRKVPNTSWMQIGIVLLLFSIIQAGLFVYWGTWTLLDWGGRVGMPVALAAGLLGWALKYSADYVEYPVLCTEALYPWNTEQKK